MYMHHTPRPWLRGLAFALLGLTTLGSVAIAQTDPPSDTAPISILVQPFICTGISTDVVGVDAITGGSSTIDPTATESDIDWGLTLQLNITNAVCDPWTVTAAVSDFELSTDDTKTFPGDTLHIARDSIVPDSSQGHSPVQPDWLRLIPLDLPTGNPVMPQPLAQTSGVAPTRANSVSFTEDSGTATSDTPLLESSDAAYGSPGNWSAFYRMRLFDLPTDLYFNPGTYTAELTITVQGGD